MLCGNSGNTVFYRRSTNDFILKCPQCGLLFVEPQPAKERLEEYYRTSNPDYIPGYRDQIFRRGRRILSRVNRLKPAGLLLDVGCGYGYFMDQAGKYGWKAAGVELSPAAARFARENFGLNVFAGSLAEAGLAEKSFDLISLQHTLEHIPEPLEMLTTLRDKLKDDGLLAIAVPNARSLMASLAGINWVYLSERTHLFHYTNSTLRLLLEKTGFIPTSLETCQWNTHDLLWGAKYFLKNRRTANERPETGTWDFGPETVSGREQAGRRGMAVSPGGWKSFICRAAAPLGWLAGKMNLGAEIIALAKKDLRRGG